MSNDDKISKPADEELSKLASIDSYNASLPIDSYSKESIASSTKLAAAQRIISQTAKHTKPAYRRAIERRQDDRWGYRLDRVLKALRRSYSVDRYKDTMQAVYAMSEFERRYFIKQLERHYGYK
tara:strand:- start:94 stop:465 length:372 start_codon:yes stop_codon:yes gene_type:complete